MNNGNLYRIGRAVVDGSFHTQSADEAFFSYFGNDVTYSIKRTINPDDVGKIEELFRFSDNAERKTVIRMKGINGETRWVLAGVRFFGQGGEENFYSIDFSDIFSLEENAFRRKKLLSKYRFILSLTNDLAFEYSFETKRIKIYISDCCREITITDEPLEKWREKAINSGYVLSRYTETFNTLCRDIKNGVYRFEYELETSLLTNGKTKELCLFKGVTHHTDPKNKIVYGIVSVISSRHKAKDINLSLEANKDTLSGLLNKRAVTSYAVDILSEKPNYNVNFVILDIDDFTEINSRYGHLFGDEVIYTIASIVKKEIGTRGIAGRISGGGFLIILEETRNEEDLRGILRAIRTNTEYAFSERFENFHLTCSMGVSTYPVDSTDYDELFMQADKALYLAQEKGKNRYVIYDINKHGPVEKDIENKIAFLSSGKDTTEKLAFVGNLPESLVFGRIPDISVLIEQIRSQFSLDDICVFAGNDMSLILSCGNALSRNAGYVLENNFTNRFSGDSVFVIDNVNELEGRDDNAFMQLSAENIGGAVQYLITDEEIIKGMISFCYIGRFKKWSVSDINYLVILGRLISAILRKQAFI
ncbi:MAG: GGDEF domain-containing protein [Ruminococcus sp.]|nr:GGDEF domain-containing protein [Ruminococcus sp.]